MRPLRLEFQAFGSFPGTESIDFSVLAARGLFVVTGPTGSGKTTIFDAMTYALYGKVPGDRPDGEARSHHAAVGTPTFVEFEFEVERGRFIVRRCPSYERAKLRGEGTTTSLSTSELIEVLPDGTHRPLAARAGECNSWCTELVGLSASEFQRVVLLPQGKFSSFLLASSGDREPLLRQLFGGELYQRATRQLDLRVKALRLDVAALDEERRHHLDNARTELADESTAGESTADAVAAALAEVQMMVPARTATVSSLKRTCDEAAASFARVEREAEQWTVRQRLRDDLAALEAMREQRDIEGRIVEAARRARPIADAGEVLDAARTRAEVAGAELHKAVADTRTLLDSLGLTALLASADGDEQFPVPAVSAAAASMEAELDDRRRRLRDADAAAGGAARAQADAAAALEAVGTADAALAAVEAAQRQRLARRAELEPVAGLLEARELHLVAARSRLAARELLDVRVVELEAARDAVTGAHAAYLDVITRYVATQAPRLAAELRPDEPCPVCGSVEHPTPAAAEDDEMVDHDAVDHARLAHQQAASRVSGLEEAVASLHAGLDDHVDVAVEDLRAQVDATSDELEMSRAARHEMSALHLKIGDQQHALEQHQAGAIAARESATGLTATAVAKQTDAAQLAVAVAGIDPSLLDREAATLGELHRSVAELPDLQMNLISSRASYEGALAHLDRALVHSGFESIDDALAAAKHPDELECLAAEVEAWHRQFVATTERLATFAEIDLPADRPDLEAARCLAESTAAVHDEARAELDAHLGSLQRCRRALDAIAELDAGSRDVRDRFELARRVFATCNGETASRVRLETWVLAHQLDRVTDMANVHLGRMTSHRYQLQRVDGGSGSASRARTGLDLVVLDAHTGRARSTSTLSGGEQFQASLALALGLADVVSHGGVSSGRSFDALFVDEGFGSLDPDALDLAIAALQQLQASGRMVGAITHVEAMKQQLPVGVEVRRLPDTGGSTLVVR